MMVTAQFCTLFFAATECSIVFCLHRLEKDRWKCSPNVYQIPQVVGLARRREQPQGERSSLKEERKETMHVFIVSNGAIAFFVTFIFVAAIIKLKKKMVAAESAAKAAEEKAAGSSRVRIAAVDRCSSETPDPVVWAGDKSAPKNADINKGLF
jgi:hypothetical protein